MSHSVARFEVSAWFYPLYVSFCCLIRSFCLILSSLCLTLLPDLVNYFNFLRFQNSTQPKTNEKPQYRHQLSIWDPEYRVKPIGSPCKTIQASAAGERPWQTSHSKARTVHLNLPLKSTIKPEIMQSEICFIFCLLFEPYVIFKYCPITHPHAPLILCDPKFVTLFPCRFLSKTFTVDVVV